MEQTSGVKKRILIIEDEKFLRDLYVQVLTDEGYEVTGAADGEEGINAIKNNNYDLVLTDILMPKLNGIDLLKKIKAENPQVLLNTKIVLLTNLGQESTISEGLKIGAAGCLVKSDYTPDKLVEIIKKYLN